MSKIISKLSCPRCGCKEFIQGPRGGMGSNVKCASCDYWMNICPLPDGRYWIVDEEAEG